MDRFSRVNLIDAVIIIKNIAAPYKRDGWGRRAGRVRYAVGPSGLGRVRVSNLKDHPY
jgi:hypothetical protein